MGTLNAGAFSNPWDPGSLLHEKVLRSLEIWLWVPGLFWKVGFFFVGNRSQKPCKKPYIYILYYILYIHTIYETLNVQHSYEATCHRGQSAPGWTFGLGDLPPAVEVKALRWSLCHLYGRKRSPWFISCLKSLEISRSWHLFVHLWIYTRQFKSRDDRDKRTMIGPDKEFKLCDVETQHAGLVCSSYKWLGCAEHPTRSGGCSCHPGIFADRKKQPFVGGTCFFCLCFLFLRNYVAFYICRECAGAYGLTIRTISIHEYCDALWLHAPDI